MDTVFTALNTSFMGALSWTDLMNCLFVNKPVSGGFMSAQSIGYRFEVYEESFTNAPVWSVEAITPFPAVSIGDRFNHLGLDVAWGRTATDEEEYRVVDIDHYFSQSEGKLAYKTMVKLMLKHRNQVY
ncbi:hypothetical protein [Pseudomonas sp. MHK4]